MLDALVGHLVEHIFIYLGLLVVTVFLYRHVFYDCWQNSAAHKLFLQESRLERERMEQLLQSLRETKGQCPLYLENPGV